MCRLLSKFQLQAPRGTGYGHWGSLLLWLGLTSPLWAQPTAPDLLLQYGSQLRLVLERYDLERRMTDLATPDQVEALHRLRVSPRQALDLLKLVRDNLPEGPLDEKARKELRRKITPRAEDILGAEEFDRLLELVPSPQQEEQMQAILHQAAATPEGRQALAAAQQVSPSLSAEQKRFLEPALDLLRDPARTSLSPLPLNQSKSRPERRLIFLRKTSVGETYGEIRPEANFTEYQTMRLRLSGADPQILSNLSNAAGLPVRVLSQVQGDRLIIAGGAFSEAPALLPMSGQDTVWHGRLPARLLSLDPPQVELDAGRGQKLQAVLEFTSLKERQGFQAYASPGRFLLGATAVGGASATKLVDLDFGPWPEPEQTCGSALMLQLSEEILARAAEEYRTGHPDLAGAGSERVSLQLSRLGITLQDCRAGEVRVFGQLTASHSGLMVLQANFEVVASAGLEVGHLRLKPVPKSLRAGLTFPLYAPAPPVWMENLERVLGDEYARGVSLDLSAQQRQKLLDTALLNDAQLDAGPRFLLGSGARRP
jgi:hypothetical protein